MKLLLIAVLTLGLSARTEIPENQTLGDVMMMLADQMVGLGEFSKASPANLEDKVFSRALHRARGAQYLLKLANEKKGRLVEEGTFIKDELTPGKFLTLSGLDLQIAVARFEEALTNVSGKFSVLESEVQSQRQLPAEQRNFRKLKLLLIELDDLMKKAHQEFKPEH